MAATEGFGIKIVENERFYNDKYLQVVLLMLMIAFLGICLFGLNFLFYSTSSPPPTYFEANEQGSIIPDAPLDQSNMEINALLNWVTEGMMLGNTFNFMNYNYVMSQAAPYFTKEGFDSYKNALNNAKIIDRILQKKLVLKTVPTDAPQVLLEKSFAGRYMWKIKVPLKFHYQSVTTDLLEMMDATLIVMRVQTTQSPNGVLILKYELTPSEK